MTEYRDTAHLYDEMKGNAVIMLRYTLAERYEDATQFPRSLPPEDVISMACALAGMAADLIECFFEDAPEEIDQYLMEYLTAPYPDGNLES